VSGYDDGTGRFEAAQQQLDRDAKMRAKLDAALEVRLAEQRAQDEAREAKDRAWWEAWEAEKRARDEAWKAEWAARRNPGQPRVTDVTVVSLPAPRAITAGPSGGNHTPEEVAQLLHRAIERLDWATESTGLNVEDMAGWGRLFNLAEALENATAWAGQDLRSDWDGEESLAGGEQALTEAWALLGEAGDGGQFDAISQAMGEVEDAQQLAQEAREAFEAMEAARQSLAELVAAALRDSERLRELVRQATAKAVEASDAAYTAQGLAQDVAEQVVS
jgi:hypothetical protein